MFHTEKEGLLTDFVAVEMVLRVVETWEVKVPHQPPGHRSSCNRSMTLGVVRNIEYDMLACEGWSGSKEWRWTDDAGANRSMRTSTNEQPVPPPRRSASCPWRMFAHIRLKRLLMSWPGLNDAGVLNFTVREGSL